MAKSAKQIEAEVLAFLDSQSIGESASEFQFKRFEKDLSKVKGLERLLILSAANFILKVQENLTQSGKVDTGGLLDGLTQGDILQNGDSLEISVGYLANSKAAKYYDFVNKGVKGTRSGPDSPYSFKNDKPGYAMTSALSGWYKRHANFARKETQKTNLSAVQRKRKKLSKMVSEASRLKSLAYATAVNIKRRGLKKTGFFDKAIQSSFGPEFYQAIARITGKEIAINIRQYGNNNK